MIQTDREIREITRVCLLSLQKPDCFVRMPLERPSMKQIDETDGLLHFE